MNDPNLRNEQYDRFLENRFREEFPNLEGSPLRFIYRRNPGKSRRARKPKTVKIAADQKGIEAIATPIGRKMMSNE